ncbi:MAG: hypothetical protein OXC59_07400, partial [Acidimicrobiaceae bacterium]|nr:hypothetical protein [Acidimicrobiaceae bacterium]
MTDIRRRRGRDKISITTRRAARHEQQPETLTRIKKLDTAVTRIRRNQRPIRSHPQHTIIIKH